MVINMKPYIYVIHKCHHRTFEKIAVIVGVVLAETEEAAIQKAWEKSGGDTCSLVLIEEIPQDGFSYYIPCRQFW